MIKDMKQFIKISGFTAYFYLNHDLGEIKNSYNELTQTGYDMCRWMVENNFLLAIFISIL